MEILLRYNIDWEKVEQVIRATSSQYSSELFS